MGAGAALAVLLAATAARAEDTRLVALLDDDVLLRFTAAAPGTVERVAVSGVRGSLVGIDCRPSDGRLYGVSTTYDVYRIDPVSGAASAVSTLTVPFDGGPRSGLDFNPQADRLRLVAASGRNLRVNVTMGATASDGGLAYAPGDRHHGRRPAVTAAAYGNNRPDAPTTKLFDLDAALDVLVLQEPPNDGVLTTIGPLGIDVGEQAGFDIETDAAGADHGFIAAAGTLHTVDLTTGTTRALGEIAGRPEVLGLAALGACK